MEIKILPNQFLLDDGTFDLDHALNFCGKIAGVCYSKEGFQALENEDVEKTNRRIKRTLTSGHHSVYDHVFINFDIKNIPKILAMVLNNEKQYTTSEKSARYTKFERQDGSIITEKEEELYNKWLDIFEEKIKKSYSNVYQDSKIIKLAQENARYLVSVFMPTEMIYTTSLRQINYIAAYMIKYISNVNKKIDSTNFETKLANYMKEFITNLTDLNVLNAELMKNEKNSSLSLFTTSINPNESYFGDIYLTTYKGSLAELAQAQRHRTLNYQMKFLDKKEYFVPPILEDEKSLVEEWLEDINSVKEVTPQGELVLIKESGTYENFILKCKERLCSAAQLEIMKQTRETLLQYKDALEKTNHPLLQDIERYSHGARCTFDDYTCSNDCHFKEGKTLQRKI